LASEDWRRPWRSSPPASRGELRLLVLAFVRVLRLTALECVPSEGSHRVSSVLWRAPTHRCISVDSKRYDGLSYFRNPHGGYRRGSAAQASVTTGNTHIPWDSRPGVQAAQEKPSIRDPAHKPIPGQRRPFPPNLRTRSARRRHPDRTRAIGPAPRVGDWGVNRTSAQAGQKLEQLHRLTGERGRRHNFEKLDVEHTLMVFPLVGDPAWWCSGSTSHPPTIPDVRSAPCAAPQYVLVRPMSIPKHKWRSPPRQ